MELMEIIAIRPTRRPCVEGGHRPRDIAGWRTEVWRVFEEDATALLGRRRLVAGWRLHHLEVRTLELAQLLVQDGDARVGRDRDRPIDAIVRHEHAVFLQALEDRLHVEREAADIDVLA